MNTKQQNQTNYYDYGFRQFDAQLGRWHVVDAMSEKYFSQSPYNYVGNDPVSRTDFMGLTYRYKDPSEEAELNQWLHGGGIASAINGINNHISNNLNNVRSSARNISLLGTINGVQGTTVNDVRTITDVKGFIEWVNVTFENRSDIQVDFNGTDLFFYSWKTDDDKNIPVCLAVGLSQLPTELFSNSYDSESSSSWFTDNRDDANVASWVLGFLTSAEHAAEVTDGAGSGVLFNAAGKIVFVAGALYNVGVIREDIKNKNYNHAGKTGLDIFYSAVMTWGGPPGWVLGGTMLIINNTIGIDNIIRMQGEMQIERADRMNRGDYSMWGLSPSFYH